VPRWSGVVRIRPSVQSLCAGVLAAGLAACDDSISDPAIDCRVFEGLVFIELAPAPSGTFVDYQVNVGDSIQVSGSLHRVDRAEPAFNVQQGWSCRTTASSPVSGTVSLSTTSSEIVQLRPGGWIRGLIPGLAIVTASSTEPAASADIGVLVYSP
jgi:hypothetical protein